MKKLTLSFIAMLCGMFVMAQPPQVPAEKGAQFGQKLTADNAVTVQQLTNLMNGTPASRQIRTKITGVVSEVCKKEGCWIRLQSPDGSMMVKMKDHKFTVPVALNGKTVVIDGIVEIKETSVAELKHLAEDAKKSKAEIDAIKEPKKEIVVQALGLLVI